jgi:integrase/recombinase XerD
MSTLAQRAEEYLVIRRALGYKLSGYDAILRDFTGWLQAAGAQFVTAELALAWAQSRPTSSPIRVRQRLTMVRLFTEYLSGLDPRTEVPAADVVPVRYHRLAPYIYSRAEISELMAAARSLAPPLRAATYETLIGLLACSGLRFGEAAGLDRSDLNVSEGSLLVRFAKNGRSRQVPLQATTVAALSSYATRRDRFCPHPHVPNFFLSTRGGPLAQSSVQALFTTLRQMTGLDQRGHGRRPRLHDLRHTFVVRTMLAWYRDGVDVQARLPLLSTYLGHVDPKATYWYQQAVPELFSLVAGQLEPGTGHEQ